MRNFVCHTEQFGLYPRHCRDSRKGLVRGVRESDFSYCDVTQVGVCNRLEGGRLGTVESGNYGRRYNEGELLYLYKYMNFKKECIHVLLV
jgi:hypothetical protein